MWYYKSRYKYENKNFTGKIYIQGGLNGFNYKHSNDDVKKAIQIPNSWDINNDKIQKGINVNNRYVYIFKQELTKNYYLTKNMIENMYKYLDDISVLLYTIYDINTGFLLCRIDPSKEFSPSVIHKSNNMDAIGTESNYKPIENLYNKIKKLKQLTQNIKFIMILINCTS